MSYETFKQLLAVFVIALLVSLVVVLTVHAATPPLDRRLPSSEGQSRFIMNELQHMGWVCGLQPSLIEWTCTSPDKLREIHGYDVHGPVAR